MHNSFGPWSTSVGAETQPRLNSFWKRRLAMLATVSGTKFVLTRRKMLCLALVAAAALALPTFYIAPLAGVLAGDEGRSAETKQSSADPQVEYLPRPSPVEVQILKALDQPTNLAFTDMPLQEAVNFLREQHKINIWMDENALREEGIETTQPVTLQISNVTLRSALRLLLNPLNLTFLIDDEVLKITSEQKAGDTLFTRTYPVRDLCGQANEFDELADAIRWTVAPDTWEDAGRTVSVVPVQGSGSVVIRQSYDVHTKILQLLRTLREAKQKVVSK